MSGASTSLYDVLTGLSAEGRMPTDWEQRAGDALQKVDVPQPWYVRAMVGFGAWLASLFLISFVASLTFITEESGFIITGLLCIGGATWLRRVRDGDFSNQMALAVSLAGQVMFAWGLASILKHDNVETVLFTLIVVQLILIAFYPDSTHRSLSVILITVESLALLYIWEWQWAIPFIGPLLAAAVVWSVQLEPELITAQSELLPEKLWRPVMNGLLISAFGSLMLSTVYILPELDSGFSIYPRPWISAVMLGLLLLYVERPIWHAIFGSDQGVPALVMYGCTVAIVIAALQAPGLLLALVVIALGAAHGNRAYLGAGVGFLVIFTGAYFYGIEITLLKKSMTLIATGGAVLAARVIFNKLAAARQEGAHA